MRLVAAIFVLALALVTMPGMAEIAENVLHLVAEGHSAHADVDHEHAPANEEHGCSGPFHLCRCCHSPAFEALAPARLPVATSSAFPFTSPAPDQPHAAHVRVVYRPPIA